MKFTSFVESFLSKKKDNSLGKFVRRLRILAQISLIMNFVILFQSSCGQTFNSHQVISGNAISTFPYLTITKLGAVRPSVSFAAVADAYFTTKLPPPSPPLLAFLIVKLPPPRTNDREINAIQDSSPAAGPKSYGWRCDGRWHFMGAKLFPVQTRYETIKLYPLCVWCGEADPK